MVTPLVYRDKGDGGDGGHGGIVIKVVVEMVVGGGDGVWDGGDGGGDGGDHFWGMGYSGECWGMGDTMMGPFIM